jgi:HAD superfamily hydrolase (TIGR01459 family)
LTGRNDAASTTAMIEHATLSQLRERYDTLYCDVWGVIRDGHRLLPDAIHALQQFRQSGGRVCLVSNSPRRNESLGAMLSGMGLPGDAIDGIVTSGDAIYAQLAKRSPGKALRIGPDFDDALYADLELEFVDIETADFISCTGPDDYWDGKPEDYQAILERALERKLDLVCANPDIVVQAEDKLIFCAGAIARLYRHMGGTSVVAGKPHAPIYKLAAQCLEQSGERPDLKNILAVGDGPETDLEGATRAGIDALFIADGILGSAGDARNFDIDAISSALKSYRVDARWAAPQLIW